MIKDSLPSDAVLSSTSPATKRPDSKVGVRCPVAIRGLGVAPPPRVIEQGRAAEISTAFVYGDAKQKRAVPALFRRTRVRRRGSVLLESDPGNGPEQSFYQPATSLEDRGPTTALRMQRYEAEAGPLAAIAAQRALTAAQIAPHRITHLINVSCTGFFAPGIDVALIRQLGLPPTVGRVQVGFMGCHGVLNGLCLTRAFVEADPSAHVLLCAVELCSLHFQYGSAPDQLVANALFADGAAALVAAAAVEANDPWQIAATTSLLLPDCEEAMSWRIGDHGFEMTLSATVPAVIASHVRPWLEDWLHTHELSVATVGSWAIHPGGPRILESVAAALGLPANATVASVEILADRGNMSSASVLFVLDRLQKTGAPRPTVMLAFGPGLVAEAALLI
ncbi:MAG: type III polyketide synthase [Pirellulaceae bacterium]